MNCEKSARRLSVQPDGAERQSAEPALQRRSDYRTPRRDYHVFRYQRLPFDPDYLSPHLAGYELLALADRATIRPKLLDEEIDRIDQAGGNPPGGKAVVAETDRRRADESSAGGRPGGRLQMGEVPVGRQRWVEMRVVRDNRAAGRGPGTGEGPVI